MSTEEQKDNEEREGGELEAGTPRREASAEDSADEGTVTAADSREDDDEDEGEDEGDDETSAGASSASASASAAKAAAARASAGARLAAAKAAKAAKKAAKKAQIAAASAESDDADSLVGTGGGMPAKAPEEVLKESPIGQAATKAGEWASANRSMAAGIVGVLVIGALGWVGYSWWNASQAEAAGALLTEALEISNAEIVAADAESESDDEDEITFETREARAQASLEAYRRVLSDHPSSEAARWARLGEARALFDLGQNEEAREVYERALREAGGDPIVAWRAMEGIGFTYEVDQQWDQAIEQYQELRSIEDGAYEAPADYNIARMRIAKGERVEATTALRALIERLRPEEASEEPAFPYVLAQAEVRLRELDPGSGSGSGSPMMIGPDGPGGAGGLPPGLEGIDPQILEQLRRQLAGGAGGGGAEGAPE